MIAERSDPEGSDVARTSETNRSENAHRGPRVEGTVRLPDGRRLGFAEFGAPNGRGVIWLHGTPGARRQVPVEAHRLGEQLGLRIIGVDRPGIGSSTPHLHRTIADFAADLEVLADRIGLGPFATIGLSGGGPYALAAAARLEGRVPVVSVLGGVAPTVGPDAIAGGLVSVGKMFEPVLSRTRVPLAFAVHRAVRFTRPAASQAIDLYARLSPEGDRALLRRPEFKSMFLDDLLNGSRRQFGAVFSDILLFCRHWGFDAADVTAPVRWWHGDADNIIPYAHGEHLAARLPDAVLHTLPGAGHLAGLGIADRLLGDLDRTWTRALGGAT